MTLVWFLITLTSLHLTQCLSEVSIATDFHSTWQINRRFHEVGNVTLKPVVVWFTIGDATLIPPPLNNDSASFVVLYTTADGLTKRNCTISPPLYSILSKSKVSSATLSFDIVSINGPATIEVVGVDANQNSVGKVQLAASKAGTVPADITTLLKDSSSGRQIIIGGKAITFTMNVLTPNVSGITF